MKTCFKLWGNCNFSLVKTLAKIPKNWGLYRPKQKLAVRLIWQPDRLAVGRPGRPPTVRNVTVWAARSTPRYREQSSLVRSAARPTVPVAAKRAQVCARRSTQGSIGLWCGRPVRSADLACQPLFWDRNTC